MPPKVTKMSEKPEPVAVAATSSISKVDLIASLAELKTSMLAEIKKSFDEVNGKLDGLQKTVNTHGERLNSLEDNTETFHQRLAEVEACCERLQADNTKVKSRLTEMEGRSRRNNVRLIGLPEGIEGPQPSGFFSQLLQDVFGPDTFPSPAELDRAHRSLAPKPGPGGKPRPVIICLHGYLKDGASVCGLPSVAASAVCVGTVCLACCSKCQRFTCVRSPNTARSSIFCQRSSKFGS